MATIKFIEYYPSSLAIEWGEACPGQQIEYHIQSEHEQRELIKALWQENIEEELSPGDTALLDKYLSSYQRGSTQTQKET